MDSHPSCRRPHKLPAHTFKERRNRPQRLHPCPDVSVEVSRTFWQLVLEVSTPRRGFFIFPSAWQRAASVEVSRTLWRLSLDPSTSREGIVPFPFPRQPRTIDPFPPREPPIIGGFRRTATPFCEGFRLSGPAPATSRRKSAAARGAHCARWQWAWEAPPARRRQMSAAGMTRQLICSLEHASSRPWPVAPSSLPVCM